MVRAIKIEKGIHKGRVAVKMPCGCNTQYISVDSPNSFGAQWKWNGDCENPTFEPSINSSWEFKGHLCRCHVFITNGVVEFLPDCTHNANDKMPLREFLDYEIDHYLYGEN